MFNKALFKSLTIPSVISLYNTFLFRKGFFDFFQEMHKEGIETARRFWNLCPYKNVLLTDPLDIYEKMIDFYLALGYSPRLKYDNALTEHEKLHYENIFLRETIRQLYLKIFADAEEKVQRAWNSFLDNLLETNAEMAPKFLELFGQRRKDLSEKGKQEAFDNVERRHENRRHFLYPVEFVLTDSDDKPVKGAILNMGNSGLCIYAFILLDKDQRITIKSFLPIRHRTFTVKWTKAYMTGLAAYFVNVLHSSPNLGG